MERLLFFVYQNRAFLTFLALEIFCAWLIVQNNQYQGTKFFNSSNGLVATMNNFSQGVRDYFQLSEVNRMLAEENAALKKRLGQPARPTIYSADSLTIHDSVMVKQFDFMSAKVVNNHVDFFKNYITIDKGRDAGVEPGMGVISPLGVVGKVKTVSKHYSVVTSILHIDWMVSALLKRTGDFGTVQWPGTDPDHIVLKYMPPHVKPVVGDTVVTSSFNAIFPEGVMIGVVDHVELRSGVLFYDLNVKLSQDFRKLSFVTLVKNHLIQEQDSIEQVIQKLER